VFDTTVKKSVSVLRRLVVLVIGVTVLLVGIIMIFTPGPAVIVIPAGLGILALEFVWARTLLRRTKGYLASQASRLKTQPSGPTNLPPAP
jgi:uncharacterized protein (TIGR02611 family)